jgi:hypothetical protein
MVSETLKSTYYSLWQLRRLQSEYSSFPKLQDCPEEYEIYAEMPFFFYSFDRQLNPLQGLLSVALWSFCMLHLKYFLRHELIVNLEPVC